MADGAALSNIRVLELGSMLAGPFVGKLNNDRVRKALRGAIDSFLTTMLVDEALTGYELDVTATRADVALIDLREQSERERGPDAFTQHVGDGSPLESERDAEIPAKQMTHVDDVLLSDRPIEPVVRVHVRGERR